MFSTFVITPSGPTRPSNFLALCTVLPALCVIFVVLRFNVRRMQKASLLIDDWLALSALLFVLGMAICGLIGSVFFALHSSPMLTTFRGDAWSMGTPYST